jgi:hypothetical protein
MLRNRDSEKGIINICERHLLGLYFSPKHGWSLKGEGMGYKKWGKEISLADLAVGKSLEHNGSSR